jgi:hypothetical protein
MTHAILYLGNDLLVLFLDTGTAYTGLTGLAVTLRRTGLQDGSDILREF